MIIKTCHELSGATQVFLRHRGGASEPAIITKKLCSATALSCRDSNQLEESCSFGSK